MRPDDSLPPALACSLGEARLADCVAACRREAQHESCIPLTDSAVGHDLDGMSEILVTVSRHLDELRLCLSCGTPDCDGKYYAVQACAEAADLMGALSGRLHANAHYLLDGIEAARRPKREVTAA